MNAAPRRPADQRIVCHCGQVLAERWGDCVAIAHKGRRIIARELVTIQCEGCGRVWTPESDTLSKT